MAEKYKHGQRVVKRLGLVYAEARPADSRRGRRRPGLPVAAIQAGLMVLTTVILTPVGAAHASHGEGGAWNLQYVQLARVITRQGEWVEVKDEPLLGVVDEINRRSERKLKVDRKDPRFRRLKVTGRFKTDRPETLVQYIRAAGIPVRVTKDRDGNIILRLR